jgi:hypothetical protein
MLSALCWPVAAQVKVWQGTLTFPTYEEGPPDPNPPFDTYQTTRFNYPYTLRTNLTGVKADHASRAIFLTGDAPAMKMDGRSARQYVMLAGIARSCGQAKESEELFHKAAAQVDSADPAWTIQAEKSLGTYHAEEAEQRLATRLAAAESSAETGVNSGSWWYNIGLLQAALKRRERARESFDKALILPDTHMSHHLAREALAALSAVR